MEITKTDIIDRVKCRMEELTPQWEGNFEQTEGESIERYINEIIDEQLRILYMTAPTAILPVEEVASQHKPTKRTDGTGRIVLNDNVLRPISLQLDGWERPVTRFIDENHPLYELQFNRYTRGGVVNPVASLISDGLGRMVIDYFSLPTSRQVHTLSSLLCILHPAAQADSYNLNPLLIDALCYRCAATVYDIMGNNAMAQTMQSHVEL